MWAHLTRRGSKFDFGSQSKFQFSLIPLLPKNCKKIIFHIGTLPNKFQDCQGRGIQVKVPVTDCKFYTKIGLSMKYLNSKLLPPLVRWVGKMLRECCSFKIYEVFAEECIDKMWSCG